MPTCMAYTTFEGSLYFAPYGPTVQENQTRLSLFTTAWHGLTLFSFFAAAQFDAFDLRSIMLSLCGTRKRFSRSCAWLCSAFKGIYRD